MARGGRTEMHQMRRDEVARELIAMAQDDQKMRRRALEGHTAHGPEVDQRNSARLRGIVDEIGWPTRSKVGRDAEHAAWLLAQHADHDRAFQKRCLELMRAEPATEVCAHHLAYLEDRIAVGDGRPQRYGTQVRSGADGSYVPAPLDDPARVHELRRSVGLEPLDEYIATVNAMFARSRGGSASPR